MFFRGWIDVLFGARASVLGVLEPRPGAAAFISKSRENLAAASCVTSLLLRRRLCAAQVPATIYLEFYRLDRGEPLYEQVAAKHLPPSHVRKCDKIARPRPHAKRTAGERPWIARSDHIFGHAWPEGALL